MPNARPASSLLNTSSSVTVWLALLRLDHGHDDNSLVIGVGSLVGVAVVCTARGSQQAVREAGLDPSDILRNWRANTMLVRAALDRLSTEAHVTENLIRATLRRQPDRSPDPSHETRRQRAGSPAQAGLRPTPLRPRSRWRTP
jgi:hypothetical protein